MDGHLKLPRFFKLPTLTQNGFQREKRFTMYILQRERLKKQKHCLKIATL
jgi:hypothetical protein